MPVEEVIVSQLPVHQPLLVIEHEVGLIGLFNGEEFITLLKVAVAEGIVGGM